MMLNACTANEVNKHDFPIEADAVKENWTMLSSWSSILWTVCLWLFLSGLMKGEAICDKIGLLTIFRNNTVLWIQWQLQFPLRCSCKIACILRMKNTFMYQNSWHTCHYLKKKTQITFSNILRMAFQTLSLDYKIFQHNQPWPHC